MCDAYVPDVALEKKCGNGSVVFKSADNTPLARAAVAFMSVADAEGFFKVETLIAAFAPVEGTIRSILKLTVPAKMEAKSQKDGSFVVRFIERTESGSTRGQTLRFNKGLTTDETWKVIEQARARNAGA